MAVGTSAQPRIQVQQRWLVLALLVFFIGLSIHYSVKVVGGNSETRSAILRWREPLQQLDSGTDIYLRYNFPYPPVLALLLQPLTRLPLLGEALVWFYLKVAMTFLALHLVFRLVETPERPFPLAAKGITVLLSLWPIMGDLQHGNVNLFILLLVVVCLYAFRQGYDGLAGVVLGLAIACKVTPALFVPYFLWKRAWKSLAGCALGLVLFFWLVPGVFLGMQRNVQLLGSWTEQMIQPYLVSGEVFYSEYYNQSLPGLVLRLATHRPSFSTYLNEQYTPLAYHNLADLDPRYAGWIVKGCMALFALLIVWCCRTPTRRREGWRLAAEFGLVVLGMLLFSERTWKHHCVTLLLPFSVLCYYLTSEQPGRKLRAYLIGTLFAAGLLILSASIGNKDDSLGKMAQVYGVYVWAYILLAAALVTLLRTSEAGERGC